MTVRDRRDYTRVLLYSVYTLLQGGGVHLRSHLLRFLAIRLGRSLSAFSRFAGILPLGREVASAAAKEEKAPVLVIRIA